ncbi:PLAC8 family [Phytophthora infestans]|uniref:PLAC8 family n=1 Tax=Phytophthora infestans TaxID=4787 RepID=A0A8S9VCS9_PHYIN|nr:PLAC8 family [Phytophthora infestans]
MNQAPSTQTPAAPVEAPYWEQQNGTVQAAKPGVMKDLESEDGLTRGQWQVGFWDCFTTLMPNCFMVTFCSCVSVAQISARLGVTTYSKALITCLVIILAEYVISGIAARAASSSYTVETNYTTDGTSYTYSTSSDSGAAVIVYRGVTIMVHVLFALFVMHLRTTTRERFQIPGSTRNDFFAGFCCSCCALAQMATHVKSYTPGSCEFGQVAATLPPYTK